MNKKISLNRYLSLKLTFVAILPIFVIAALSFQFLVPQSKRQIAIQHESMARAVAGQISAHLKAGERKLISLSNFLESQPTWDDSNVTPLLTANCGAGDLFETIYIASTQENNIRFVGLAKKETEINRLSRDDLLGLDLSGSDFMFLTNTIKTPTWSETFLSTASSSLAVALTVPVQKDVIIGEITLDRLSELISHLPVEANIIIFVLDRHGRIIADSEQARWGRQVNLKGLQKQKSISNQSIFSTTFSLYGKQMLGTNVTLDHLGWNVLIAQPIKTAYSPLIIIITTLVSGLGFALLLSLIVSWLQAGKLTNKFLYYTKVANQVAQEKYELKLIQADISEFDELGRHLQRMATLIGRREKKLRLTQASFDHASISILQMDENGKILNANQCACNSLGYTLNELIDMTIMYINPSLTMEQHIKNHAKLEKESQLIFEATHQRKDGSVFPAEVMLNLHEFEGEKVAIAFLKDLTALKEAEREKETTEKQLLQSQKLEAIGTLAGGIAHDFNNILTSIIGFTQITMSTLSPENDKSQKNLNKVLQAGLRARDLVAHILTFSRQDEEKFKSLQITSIVKEVIKLLRASIPANIEIKFQNSAGYCSVYADPVQIHQILMNLCTNAYHAIGTQQGLINISLEETEIGPNDFSEVSEIKAGKHLKLGVSDTGHGIDNDTLNRIFDPYFTTKRKGEGTGLGLSVVHGIVKKHHGHITAYSEPGQGTSFYIYIPCTEDKASAVQKTVKQEVPTGSEHVLVVDDELIITEMLEGILDHLGYRVTAFNDSEAAIDFFESTPNACDLIITDMSMPIMNGEEFSRRIRKTDTHTPIIILTGFSEKLNHEVLGSIGVKDVLKKPVLELELAQSIRKVIDQ